MSDPRVRPRHPKKSAFSCDVCRKRKVKCDGGHPICDRCRIRGDACVYKLSPTLSYTQRLEQRVAELEGALTKENGTVGEPSVSSCSNVPSPALDSPLSQGPSSIAESTRVTRVGGVSFSESTSLFQLPGSLQIHALKSTQTDQDVDARRERLVNSAWRERAFEKLADTPEPYRSLMDSHFCWIQPLFNFIYRPAFTRDMKTGGPYFSQALLNAVLAHSVRWCRNEPGMSELLAPFDNGAVFAKMAITELFHDIEHGNSKIPTVQALLLLSAQQCGSGNRTQAWLYSGMAFRLIDDMGICVDGKRYADADHFSTEDIEVRNRLFWSCYFWDKLISLYFGRSPMIQHSEISPPRILMDDTAEIEPWLPHGLLSTDYPPKQAHSISCFIQMCGLAEILNQVLIHLYNPSRQLSPSQAFQCAILESSKLQTWWQELPQHLKIDAIATSIDCPPSHIVTLNCIYHTINILLNRAKLKLSRESELAAEIVEHNPLIHCISSATSIVALFNLYRGAFGEGHVVLSLAYSVYTAASIFLLELQALGHVATLTFERLSFCVGVLDSLRHSNPVITTGLNLISKELEALGIPISPMRSVDIAPLSLTGDIPSMRTYDSSGTSQSDSQRTDFLHTDSTFLNPAYSNEQLEGGTAYNLLDMPPEMYDAFLQAEPISVTMDPGFDIF